jgi:hypothetical protein
VRTVSLKKARLDRVYATVKAEVAERDGHRCVLCMRPTVETHHRLPRSAGGGHTYANLITVHGPGNAAGCHGLIHRNPTFSRVLGYTVPRMQHPDVWPLCIGGEWYQPHGDGLQPTAPHELQASLDWQGDVVEFMAAIERLPR